MPDTHTLSTTVLATSERHEMLRMAEIRLMQSEACRLGYIRDSFIADAADFLRRAGRGDLADRIDDDPWGDDALPVLAEVRKARGQ